MLVYQKRTIPLKHCIIFSECDISAILWKNPWKTPLCVYNDKVNPPSEDKVILAMRVDTELEDLVARLFIEETGKEVQRYNKANFFAGDDVREVPNRW